MKMYGMRLSPPATRSVLTVLLVALMVSTGCVQSFGGVAEPSDATTPHPTPNTGGDQTRTSSTATPQIASMCAGNGRFEVHEGWDGNVTVTIINVTDGAHDVVLNRTYTERYGVHDFDPVMRPCSDYQAVIRVDGEVKWNRTIRHYEGYEMRVEENGTVSIMGGWII